MATAPGAKPELIRTPPAQISSARVALAGTVAWLVAFVALLIVHGLGGRAGHLVWLWTCLAGLVLGALGYLLTRRHKSRGRTG
ncbi:MAG: DUF2530 domain-containing protein [Sciscionella sp.]